MTDLPSRIQDILEILENQQVEITHYNPPMFRILGIATTADKIMEAMGDQWMPIETAPTGTGDDSVHLYGPRIGRVYNCHRCDGVWVSVAADGSETEIRSDNVTHWSRPLDTPASLARSLRRPDAAPVREIQQQIDAAVDAERKRCAEIVQLARHDEIDRDFRSIIHRIEDAWDPARLEDEKAELKEGE